MRAWPTPPSCRSAHAALAGVPQAALIGYHGQTLAHDPGGAARIRQAPARIWRGQTGRRVIWDFRSEDASGGQGAPLAPFFHWACADWAVRENDGARAGLSQSGGVTT